MSQLEAIKTDWTIDDVPKGKTGLDWLIEHREDIFPWVKKEIYLNNAASVPANKFAIDAAKKYLDSHAELGAEFETVHKDRVIAVRKAVAKLLGFTEKEIEGEKISDSRANDIGFVINTTDGINKVAEGMDLKEEDEVIVLDKMREYSSNYAPWKKFAEAKKAKLIIMTGDENGFVDPQEIKKLLTPRTRLVTVSSVGFKSGQRVDIETIGKMIYRHNQSLGEGRKPTRFFVDAVQHLGAKQLNVKDAHVDYLSAGGQKWMMGENGIGIFYATEEAISDLPNLPTGANSREDWSNPDLPDKRNASIVEVGTNNGAGIWSLGAATDLISKIGMENIGQRIFELTDYLCNRLVNKGYNVYSPRKILQQSSGIVMASQPEWENKLATINSLEEEKLLSEEFKKEIDTEMSEVIKAKKLPAEKPIIFSVRGGRMRFGVHFYNTLEELDELIERLPDLRNR